MFTICLQYITIASFWGDVETSRPATKAQDKALSDVLTIVQKLETGQGTILAEIKALSERQSRTEEKVAKLENRVASLENDCPRLALDTNNYSSSGLDSENHELIALREERVSALEASTSSSEAAANVANAAMTCNPVVSALRNVLAALKSKCLDTEARSQRANLLFFGLGDTDGESWAESESN